MAESGLRRHDVRLHKREPQNPFLKTTYFMSLEGNFSQQLTFIKALEQAAGFLRVREGKQPLDASAVHPESYGLVEKMASDLGAAVKVQADSFAFGRLRDMLDFDIEDIGDLI